MELGRVWVRSAWLGSAGLESFSQETPGDSEEKQRGEGKRAARRN